MVLGKQLNSYGVPGVECHRSTPSCAALTRGYPYFSPIGVTTAYYLKNTKILMRLPCEKLDFFCLFTQKMIVQKILCAYKLTFIATEKFLPGLYSLVICSRF